MKDLMLPLKGKIKKGPFAVVDIETKDGDTQKGGFTRPFLAGHYDGVRFTSFSGSDCLQTMLMFLLSPRFDGYTYYAHNGGAFDWLHFLPHLAVSGYSFEILTVSSKIQCLKVKVKGSHRKGWTFVDSYQLIPAGLAKITKAFNTDVQKDDSFDYDTDEHDARWEDYLEKDCISLHQTLTKFYELVENVMGGEIGITAASTSMKTYRRSYQKFPISRHSQYHDFFRAAYYGGRVEIFRKKCDGVRYYDINSSYPNAMLQDMPVGDIVNCEGIPPDWVRAGRIGFASASVSVPKSTYLPVLPVKNEKGRLIFPTGNFSGIWTAVELLRAEEMGAKVTWHHSKWIKARPIFQDFVRKLYRLRDNKEPDYNESVAYVAKIMLNSLYGKFATNTLREKIIYVGETDERPEGGIPANPDDPDCSIYRVEEEIDAPYIAPQIAAHITALSRLHLHDLMSESLARGGKLAYCDTDSIQTTADMHDICSSGIGGLKDEGGGVIYTGEYLQPKLYMLSGDDGSHKVVMKGYRSRTPEAFMDAKLGGVLSFESLEKIGAMVRKGFISGPKMVTVTRAIRCEDTKREFISDDVSRPIHIDDNVLEEELEEF